MEGVGREDQTREFEEDDELLDPRIQVELEKLNTCTDEINKLETELDEGNTTFRMLLNEATRRLKILTARIGPAVIDKARPYFVAVEEARNAQAECQRAAVKFQRANEIHQAAKETVALAEARFLSKQHEWQFDSAWQEMLNHAIIKVTEAERQRVESGLDHQIKANAFNVAEHKVAKEEKERKRAIAKARIYFEEKDLCLEQLHTQKQRVVELATIIAGVKADYAASLRRLEAISEEIHHRRNKSGSVSPLPEGPRQPGVGAELDPPHLEAPPPALSIDDEELKSGVKWDLEAELERLDGRSAAGSAVSSLPTSSAPSEVGDPPDPQEVEELRLRVKELSIAGTDNWEVELKAAVTKLDNAMIQQEASQWASHSNQNDQPLPQYDPFGVCVLGDVPLVPSEPTPCRRSSPRPLTPSKISSSASEALSSNQFLVSLPKHDTLPEKTPSTQFMAQVASVSPKTLDTVREVLESADSVSEGQESAGTVRDSLQHAGTVRDCLKSAGTVRDSLESAGTVRDCLQSAGTVRDCPESASTVRDSLQSAGTVRDPCSLLIPDQESLISDPRPEISCGEFPPDRALTSTDCLPATSVEH